MGRGSRYHQAIPSAAWKRIRAKVFKRDGYRCTRCGKAGPLECHHVVSLEKGGAELYPGNLTTLCRICHVAVHRKKLSPERQAWRAFLGG